MRLPATCVAHQSEPAQPRIAGIRSGSPEQLMCQKSCRQVLRVVRGQLLWTCDESLLEIIVRPDAE